MPEIRQGLNIDNLGVTEPSEIEEHLGTRWASRGPLYNLYAASLMADYNPEFLKLHWLASNAFRQLPSEPDSSEDVMHHTPASVQGLHTYIMLGWEVGIRNELRNLTGLGLTRSQVMEIVLFSRLAAGMRGLGHVYHAIGDMLPDYRDGDGHTRWPEGWAADPEAFQCGFDMSTLDLTNADIEGLTTWYERTIGYVPNSVSFGMKHDPRILKLHRRMWEVAIRTLPKQVAPYMMLRDAMVANDRDALREAALLARAWGVSDDYIIRATTQTMHYFTSLRGLYTAHDALDDLL